MVRASYIQIYNENVSDLLRNEKKNLQIREDPKKGVYIEGVSEWAVVKPQEILELMKLGARSRAVAKTNMNESSSRSHAVFIINIEQMKQTDRDT
jgi:kinesin family protein 3/17